MHRNLSKRQIYQVLIYLFWGDHTFQVLLGATACLLKFSQNSPLRDALLRTEQCVLVECAPNDGSWGVAKSSSSLLSEVEKPDPYSLQSTEASEISFTVGSWSGNRKRRNTNALGKALMLTRSVLAGDIQALRELLVALKVVLEEMVNTPKLGLEDVQERAGDLRLLF